MIRTMLIIDDETAIRMFLRDVFESKGWIVRLATNGTDGLRFALAESGAYDAIITDMVLPDVSGAELITAIRKNGLDTPIIAITGFSDGDACLEDVKEFKVDCVVYKPFMAKEIVEAVEQVLLKRNAEIGNV